MRHMTKYVLVAALLCAAQAGRAADARADADRTAESITVRYDDLDLNTAQGVGALYVRLQGASRRVCSGIGRSSLYLFFKQQTCYGEALAAAVQQANSSALEELHRQSTARRRASLEPRPTA
jgi:UrcA family protein